MRPGPSRPRESALLDLRRPLRSAPGIRSTFWPRRGKFRGRRSQKFVAGSRRNSVVGLSRAGRVVRVGGGGAAAGLSLGDSFGALQIAQQRNCASSRRGHMSICHRSSSYARFRVLTLLCKNRVIRGQEHRTAFRWLCRLELCEVRIQQLIAVAFARQQNCAGAVRNPQCTAR